MENNFKRILKKEDELKENLRNSFEKFFSNLKILVISNITLSLIIFIYLLLQ